MTLDELKKNGISEEEKVNGIISSLGISGSMRTNVARINKDDVFTLVNLRPANEEQLKKDMEAKKDISFVPLVFLTSNGGSIGVKHFGKVEFDEEKYPDAPTIGSTATENAKFLIYCVENDVHFKVKKVIEEDEREFGGVKYTPKTYILEVTEI